MVQVLRLPIAQLHAMQVCPASCAICRKLRHWKRLDVAAKDSAQHQLDDEELRRLAAEKPEALVQKLRLLDKSQIVVAIEALSDRPDASKYAALFTGRLYDPSEQIQHAAADALASLGRKQNPVLRRKLCNPDTSEATRQFIRERLRV